MEETDGIEGQIRELDGVIANVRAQLEQMVIRRHELMGVLKYLKEMETRATETDS
jgi:hypothetical protein